MRMLLRSLVVVLVLGTAIAGSAGEAPRADVREGGIFRVSFLGFDYVDPALAYSGESWAVLDTTCARLMTLPDKPTPEGFRLVPEVAADFPRISRNGKTYTFRLRSGFRFSDGTPVRASAFARAINRTLAEGIESPAPPVHRRHRRRRGRPVREDSGRSGCHRTREHARRAVHAADRRLRSQDGDAVLLRGAADTALGPRGRRPLPVRGPVRRHGVPTRRESHDQAESLLPGNATAPRRRLRRRPPGLGASRGAGPGRARRCGLGAAIAPSYFEPGRRLVAKYGINKSQFFVRPGLVLRHLVFNNARPLFRDNAPLRRAVNFAINRRALARTATGTPLSDRLTDQYLPPSLPGFRDADIYPLERPNLERARALARGNLRGGKAVLYIEQRSSAVRGRAGSQAAARRDRARRRGAGADRSGAAQQALRAGRALGHGAHPLGSGLRGSVHVPQRALRPAGREAEATSGGSTRARSIDSCERQRACRVLSATGRTASSMPGSPATPRRPRPSASSRTRRSCRSASAVSCCDPRST